MICKLGEGWYRSQFTWLCLRSISHSAVPDDLQIGRFPIIAERFRASSLPVTSELNQFLASPMHFSIHKRNTHRSDLADIPLTKGQNIRGPGPLDMYVLKI